MRGCLTGEIETTITTHDKVNIFIHAWVPDNAARILFCVQGLGGMVGIMENLLTRLHWRALSLLLLICEDMEILKVCVEMSIDFVRYVMDVDVQLRGLLLRGQIHQSLC